MVQVFSTLCLTSNICLTAAPDVDIRAWLGPTYPRSRSWECRAQIEALCPESSAGPNREGRGTGKAPPFKFSPMGTRFYHSPLTKRSPRVKLHSFLRPLSWKSPFHLEKTSGDDLLEATGVPHTVGGDRKHLPDQCHASPGGWSQGQALSSTQDLAPVTSPSALDHSHQHTACRECSGFALTSPRTTHLPALQQNSCDTGPAPLMFNSSPWPLPPPVDRHPSNWGHQLPWWLHRVILSLPPAWPAAAVSPPHTPLKPILPGGFQHPILSWIPSCLIAHSSFSFAGFS